MNLSKEINKMEQKTAEEIVKENFKGLKDLIDDEELLIFYKKQIKICLIDFVKQQQEIAVDKALEMASENAVVISREIHHNDIIKIVDKQSILSLKPEILNELEK